MPAKNKDHLSWAHPLIYEWFSTHLGKPTEPQIQGWPSILAGKTTLISAPTGSGKTFAAFLVCLNKLVTKAASGKLQDKTEVLYVSPLKALSNDIEKNLTGPLNEMAALAKKNDQPLSEIRVAVRTGDTLAKDRQKMLKNPPHILVTTPESLYILLTAEKSRAMLANIKTVIVDEIHAMADDKRGTHLSLSLERLEAITKRPPVRIGLSATQKPLTKVAEFLTGNKKNKPVIIDIGYQRQLEIAIEVPKSELSAVASNEMWDEIYDRLAELSKTNRTMLVFANTRRVAERVAHHLSERVGKDLVTAHHGSLSRKLRLNAETKLKNGELKILVATASLELGIDIGTVDLVCLLGSPRAIAVGLQRIGRAGHWHGAISKGKIFATTRDELLECAALVYAISQGDLDQLIIPHEPLDILAQQIVATCATGEWYEDDLFAMIKKSSAYKNLSRNTFNEVIDMLSNGIAGSRGRYGAYLFRDQVNKKIKPRRNARLSAITSGGAIPENGLFTVVAEPQGTVVGTLDEDFAVESNRGDIILLGTTSWSIRRIESARGRVLVEDAHGAPPSVPFWRGEAPGRTIELSLQVSDLRKKISELLTGIHVAITDQPQSEPVLSAIDWLQKNCQLDKAGAEQLLEYVRQGQIILGAVPTQQTIIAERFFDESGGMQLIIHAPFGSRINKAWGLALRKKFCRSFNFELQAAATDDGINISLTEQHSFPLMDVFHFLHPNTIKDVLTQAVLQSPLFTTRFRWDAMRSLALLRFRNGKKTPPNILRMQAEDLLAAVFPDAAACQDNLAGRDIELPEHPLTHEAMKDALTEALDIEGLTSILKKIINGDITCLAVDSTTPSPFSHEILNANPYAFLDDAPLEERRARAVEMRRVLPNTLLQEIGKLDPAVIHEVKSASWPDLRDADELHDLLQTLIALPLEINLGAPIIIPDIWTTFFAKLQTENRVTLATSQNKKYWLAAEKVKTFSLLYPDSTFEFNPPPLEEKTQVRDSALLDMLRGWLAQIGPVTTTELAQLFNLPFNEIEQTLIKLESSGMILRGHFRNQASDEIEWCERRLLARIHKLTLGKLRKEIEPVNAAQFVRWLLNWQHVTKQTQLKGEQGLIEIIRQLQGFEMPANAWEKQIFAKRVSDYNSDLLDRLCLMGVIGWGRLSPHPAILAKQDSEFNEPTSARHKKIIPTSVAPITFFVREESDWMSRANRFSDNESMGLSHIAKSIYEFLKQHGASFFNDIERGVNHLKAEIELGLWELVAAGLITADGFDNLRALIDPKRRLLNRKRKRMSARFSAGRWYILHPNATQDSEKQTEAICWLLLKRYGVVFRDLLQREKIVTRWRDLLIVFRRLEDRGEIRGGRFVEGFLGEQFALPYACESLRASRKKPLDNQEITIAAVDPLNLVGIILPGQRVSAVSGKVIVLQDGSQISRLG